MTKKYKTILIDPPWPVDFTSTLGKGRKDQYPTMSFEEIMALPIGDIAADESNLFCWTTHTWLPKTFELIKRWGFRYHVQITWDKGGGLVCFGFHRRTEMCLYAYKGKMSLNENGTTIKTILRTMPDLLESKSTVHSRKPVSFYRLLEANTPEPRVEIFARHKRVGWDVFGNEVESDIDLLGEKVL